MSIVLCIGHCNEIVTANVFYNCNYSVLTLTALSQRQITDTLCQNLRCLQLNETESNKSLSHMKSFPKLNLYFIKISFPVFKRNISRASVGERKKKEKSTGFLTW